MEKKAIQNLVSVILPLFNGRQYLSQALCSVLAQTYRRIEIIVIDDGSTDNGTEVLSAFPSVVLLQQENRGAASARNLGLAHARGEFLAFIDQDDVWLERKVERQMSYLRENTDKYLVLCHQRIVLEEIGTQSVSSNATNRKIVECNVAQNSLETVGKQSFSPSAMLMRRSIFDLVPAFDESFPRYSEAAFFFQLRELGIEIPVLPEILILKRYHENNTSLATQNTTRELLRAARDSIRRRKSTK